MRMLAALFALLLSAAPSLAETYPTRSVRVVVGFAAGGPTDTLARILSERIAACLLPMNLRWPVTAKPMQCA